MPRFARGKKSRAISQRSGFDFPYKRAIREPGTGLIIDSRESDGAYNRVDHPQNFPPRKKGEALGLRNASPDFVPWSGPLYLHFDVSSGNSVRTWSLGDDWCRIFELPKDNVVFLSTIYVDGSAYTADSAFKINARVNEALANEQTVSTNNTTYTGIQFLSFDLVDGLTVNLSNNGQTLYQENQDLV